MKLALLGVGDVAQRDYLPEMHRIAERVELVAACGRSEARTRAVAERYGIPHIYTDVRRMLAETDAAAVVNLTPIQIHYETTLACLQAGKHVYVEKTAAGTVAEGQRLRDEAVQRGLTLVCAPSVLLYPQVERARQLLAEDAIGPVHSARGLGYGGVPPWGGYPSDPSPFFAMGGGPLVDMGVYPLHALTGLLGPARRVSAMAARAQRSFVVGDGPFAGKAVPVETPDTWQVLLDLGEGRIAAVEANNSARASKAPQMELLGLRGTIAVALLDVSAPIGLLRAGGGWEEIAVPHERARGPDHLLGVEHLAECVERGQAPRLSIEHAIHVIEIIESADRAAETGQTQELTTTF